MVAWSGEQSLGICIAAVDGKHLPGECVGCLPVAFIDRPHGPIEQLVDRGAGFELAHNPTVTTVVSGAMFAAAGILVRLTVPV